MRLIDADKLNDELANETRHGFECDYSGMLRAMKIVEGQPSVDQQGWIPCNERFPSEDGHYIATCQYSGNIYVSPDMMFDHGRWDLGHTDGVLAWMPLPGPWKGGA